MQTDTRQLTYAALFTAAFAVAGIVTRFLPQALLLPFSLQPMIVFLAGGLLKKRTALLSVTAYVLLGLIGIPVFASAPFGGFAYILKPSFGFLPGFALAVWLMALILEKSSGSVTGYILAAAAALIAYYAVGLPYMYGVLQFYLGKAISVAALFEIGLKPYIAFDLIKAGAAVLICWLVRRRLTQNSAPLA